MKTLLRWTGRLAGVASLLLAAIAVIARLRGHYTAGGYQAGTLLLAATWAMALAGASYAALLAEFGRD